MENPKVDKSKPSHTNPILVDSAEAKFQNLISQVPVLINIFIGPSFILETINEIGLEIWGKTYDQVINKSLFDSEPELEDKIKKMFYEVYTTGVPFIANEMPVQLKRAGKPDTAYFNTVYKPVRDLDHKIYGIMVIGTEVTETVIARKIIEESEKRSEKERKMLHDFFTQAPAMLAILKGPEHVYEFANPPFMEFIGNHNVIGKTAIEVLPEIARQGFIELLDNVYKSGETFTAKEMPVMLDKGNGNHQQFYANLTYQALKNHKDEIEGIRVFAYDVTEQVKARKLIEANALMVHNIYMNAPAVICTFKGPKHIYDLVNPSYQNLFDKRDLIGKPLIEALPELIGQGIDKILDNVYITGEIFTNAEILVFVAKSDQSEPQQRYYNMTMQPIYD